MSRNIPRSCGSIPSGRCRCWFTGTLELFDSTQIFEYLEDLEPARPLWPRDIQLRARARLLELKSDEIYFPHVIRLMGLQNDPASAEAVAARAGAAAYYKEVEAQLTGAQHLIGDFGFADIAFYMAQLFGERMGATLDDSTPKLLAWRERLTARPSIRAVVKPMVDFLAANGRPIPPFLAGLRSAQ